jgi:hypothetical protein
MVNPGLLIWEGEDFYLYIALDSKEAAMDESNLMIRKDEDEDIELDSTFADFCHTYLTTNSDTLEYLRFKRMDLATNKLMKRN